MALDECQVFPENTTVNILDIINRIPDKSALAWQEKLNGEMIDSYKARALADSLSKKARQESKKGNNKEKMPTLCKSELRSYRMLPKHMNLWQKQQRDWQT